MHYMVASSIPCKISLCADRKHARAGDSYVSSAIDVACPTTQNVLAIASPHELHWDSWPSSSTGTRSFCCNQQYSVTAITTSTGAVAERYAYTAYGQPTILNASPSVLSSSAINNRHMYTGREWDATLGLHHFRARWMSPVAGRFLTRDPIGPEYEHQLYRFLSDSPLFASDPKGLRPSLLSSIVDEPVGDRRWVDLPCGLKFSWILPDPNYIPAIDFGKFTECYLGKIKEGKSPIKPRQNVPKKTLVGLPKEVKDRALLWLALSACCTAYQENVRYRNGDPCWYATPNGQQPGNPPKKCWKSPSKRVPEGGPPEEGCFECCDFRACSSALVKLLDPTGGWFPNLFGKKIENPFNDVECRTNCPNGK